VAIKTLGFWGLGATDLMTVLGRLAVDSGDPLLPICILSSFLTAIDFAARGRTSWYTLAATRILRRWIEDCPYKSVAQMTVREIPSPVANNHLCYVYSDRVNKNPNTHTVILLTY